MTCIVGIKTEKGVLLGADSTGASGWNAMPRVDSKLFNLTPKVAIGFTSSYRMGQILRFHLKPPALNGDDYAWAVTEFVPAVRAALKEHGYVKIENSREESGTFLLAVRDRLFQVDSDFQVAESRHPFNSCGCGGDLALGAIHALWPGEPKEIAEAALLAAEEFSNGVRGPFDFVETKK